MARNSRISHPPGQRFLQIQFWAIKLAGEKSAGVLALLDFLDRAQEKPGQPVATRQRVIAELEGFLSRGSVDAGLKDLQERGWIVGHRITTPGPTNLQSHLEFSLCAGKINESIRIGFPGNTKLESRETQNQAQFCDPTNSSKKTEIEKQQQQPDSSGGGCSLSLEDKSLAAVLSSCPQPWRDDLLLEVEAAKKIPGKIRTTPAKYAKGVLKNWEEVGEPDSLAARERQAASELARSKHETAETSAAAEALAGRRFIGESGLKWLAVAVGKRIMLECAAENKSTPVDKNVLAAIEAGKLRELFEEKAA